MKVILNGANGRMGKVFRRVFREKLPDDTLIPVDAMGVIPVCLSKSQLPDIFTRAAQRKAGSLTLPAFHLQFQK